VKYRIIIQDRSTFQPIFRIAVNTEQGTLLDSNIQVTEALQALAFVYGYLQLFSGNVEIAPKSKEVWDYLRASIKD
jgi:hypothetical protein